jgi:hypothetical protein
LRAPLIIALLAAALPAAADAPAPSWSLAQYKARKLFMTIRLDIRVDQLSGDALVQATPTAFQGEGVMPACPRAALVTLRSETRGTVKETKLYLDPTNGAALRREQREWSSSPDFKDLRYTTTGIARLRAEPLDNEADRPPAEWGQVRRQFRAFPATPAGVPISDSSALPFLVATHEWRGPGDTSEFYVFEDQQLVRVTARAEQWLVTDVDYRTADGKVKGEERLLEVQLRTTALGNGGEVEIDLFGLSGDVRMLVDTRQRVPVEISGSVSFLGEVRFVLKQLSAASTDG